MLHRLNSGLARMPHLTAAVIALALSGSAAYAQDAKAPADAATPAPNTNQGPVNPWIKQCGQDPQSKKQLCITSQQLNAETNQFIAGLQIRKLDGEPKAVLMAVVLAGQFIQPGVRVQIDQSKPTELKYVICDANVCVAQAEVDDAFIASMKKGTKVVSMSINPQGKPMVFPFALSGFTKVYEGPGLDANAAKAKINDLQQKLQQSANQNRQKLIDQQSKEMGTTGQ